MRLALEEWRPGKSGTPAFPPFSALARPLRKWTKLALYRAEYGFSPPPPETDLVGYETLVDFIRAHSLLEIPGDLVEIGAFCGGGTCKLAKSIRKAAPEKTLHVVDCFDITLDQTLCESGFRMADFYFRLLKGRSQKEVFFRTTRGLRNISVIAADSKTVQLPVDRICFAFVDGNHSPDYVRSDFSLVWPRLSPGGVAAFHDYGFDLPQVTSTLDELCAHHRHEISVKSVHDEKHILFIQKRKG